MHSNMPVRLHSGCSPCGAERAFMRSMDALSSIRVASAATSFDLHVSSSADLSESSRARRPRSADSCARENSTEPNTISTPQAAGRLIPQTHQHGGHKTPKIQQMPGHRACSSHEIVTTALHSPAPRSCSLLSLPSARIAQQHVPWQRDVGNPVSYNVLLPHAPSPETARAHGTSARCSAWLAPR